MEAKTLNCPNCGAAASTEATKCGHCNSRLATVACPACFSLMFKGSKFCSHCGAKGDRQELAADEEFFCPRCQCDMNPVVVGKVDLRECPKCEGLWADTESLQRICTDREQQSALLGVAAPIPQALNGPLEKVRYVPCPACKKLMHRMNFARCSGVVVDVCREHGTWFDKNELRRIVEFILRGGFDKARAQEIAELERQRRQLQAARLAETHPYAESRWDRQNSPLDWGLELAAESLVKSLFGK